MNTTINRRLFASNFQKGRLTLAKLRDKATIDESIDQVNLVFPDQYGRLNGLKINAEHFLEVMENSQKEGKLGMFEYKYNPFRYDVEGTLIEINEDQDDN